MGHPVNVNNVNDVNVANDFDMTKLINDKDDLVTLLSLQTDLRQFKYLKKSVHRHQIPNPHRFHNDLLKKAIDGIGTVQRLT